MIGKNLKQVVFYLSKAGRLCIICFWELSLYVLFGLGSMWLFSSEGPSATTYLLIGALYLFTIGRKGVFSNHKVFSLAMAPCFLPAPLFCIGLLPALVTTDILYFAQCVIWISFSRWGDLFGMPRGKIFTGSVIKKVIFLQRCNGVMD